MSDLLPKTVRAVVVEMANPVHQALLDRFILGRPPMSRDELAHIWRDATNPEAANDSRPSEARQVKLRAAVKPAPAGHRSCASSPWPQVGLPNGR